MKTSITLSKSGHYTVTIQNAQKTVLFKESKIACKTVAQQIAKQAKERIENEAA